MANDIENDIESVECPDCHGRGETWRDVYFPGERSPSASSSWCVACCGEGSIFRSRKETAETERILREGLDTLTNRN